MKFWSHNACPEGFWFRIFGYGLNVVDSRKVLPSFSQRNGLKKFYMVGHWRVTVLKPVRASAAKEPAK